MIRYVVQRLFLLIPVLIGMSVIAFGVIHFIPGDPARVILGERASAAALESIREELGLNDPLIIQYLHFMGGLVQGDLGESMRTKMPIAEEILPYLASTFELTLAAMAFAVFFGIHLGILAAWKQNSWFDLVLMLVALIGVSIPIFWLGLMEQYLFAERLGWFPSGARFNHRDPIMDITHFYILDTIIAGNWKGLIDVLHHLVLPAIALGTIPLSIIARMTRSTVLESLRSDYIRTARAKGVSEFLILYKHALKNAFIPILTVIGLQTGSLLGGAVLTETIFGWPGVGRYLYDAIANRDYTVIQSGILIIAALFVLINLLVDLLYAFFDPRIRYS